MLKKILLAAAIAVFGFVALVARRPSHYRVERTSLVAAPPSTVFAQVNDFKKWSAWSPWEGLDPNQKRTLDGAPEGVGARYHWSGNDKVGEGQMSITESKPGEAIAIKLEFLRPWESTCAASFSFKPAKEGTQVTWAMEGDNNFTAKAMCLFMDMDKMIGGDFEKGLANMKKVAEAEALKQKAAEDSAKTADAAAQGGAPAHSGEAKATQ